MRHRTIFKSRWMALLWSAGILWFAVDFAGGRHDAPPTGNAAASDAGGTLNEATFDETERLVRQLDGK